MKKYKTRSEFLKRTAGFLLAVFMLQLGPLVLDDGVVDGAKAEARGRARSSQKRSSSRSTRSNKSSRSRSKASRSSRGGSRATRERTAHTRAARLRRDRRGRIIRQPDKRKAHHAPPPAAKPAPLTPEQIEANSRRESSYQTMSRAYHLYDEGLNARIRGDYNTAVTKLSESSRAFNDARGYQRSGEPSLAEAFVHYELGQAAEGALDFPTARDSYVRCLNIRPTHVEASVRLVNMLARLGQWQLALAKAQDAVRANPDDSRAHQLLSLTLNKTGHPEEARAMANKASELLKKVPRYKPMGIDAVWRRNHHEDGTVKADPVSQSPASGSDAETRKSDVDNPEDVMGVEEEEEEEEREAEQK